MRRWTGTALLCAAFIGLAAWVGVSVILQANKFLEIRATPPAPAASSTDPSLRALIAAAFHDDANSSKVRRYAAMFEAHEITAHEFIHLDETALVQAGATLGARLAIMAYLREVHSPPAPARRADPSVVVRRRRAPPTKTKSATPSDRNNTAAVSNTMVPWTRKLSWRNCDYALCESSVSCVKGFAYLLERVMRALSRANVQPFLHGGALLGAVRNQSFIPWDYNIDIMTNRSCPWLKKNWMGFQPFLSEEGLFVFWSGLPRICVYNNRTGVMPWTGKGLNKPYANINAFERMKKNSVVIDQVRYPRSHFFPLVKCKVSNVDTICPKNAHAVMKRLHGDDYMTERPEAVRFYGPEPKKKAAWSARAKEFGMIVVDGKNQTPWHSDLSWRNCKYDICESTTSCVGGMALLLGKIMRALNRANVQPFLYGGSLLGTVRNGTLIPWDHDIDLMISKSCSWLRHHYSDMQPYLGQEGLFVFWSGLPRICLYEPRSTGSEKMPWSGKGYNKPYCDMNAFQKLGKANVTIDSITYPRSHFLPLVPCTVSGVAASCPNKPRAVVKRLYSIFLAKKFGTDYLKPQPEKVRFYIPGISRTAVVKGARKR